MTQENIQPALNTLEKALLATGVVLGGIGAAIGAVYLNNYLNTGEPEYLFESLAAGFAVPLASLGAIGYKLVKDYDKIYTNK